MKTAIWRREFEAIHKGVDAQKVSDEILSIGESATPEQIVEKAKDENTELHKCFEWDDAVAAHMWRCQQARVLVSHLVISDVGDSENEEPKPQVRYFVMPRRGKGYKPIEHVFRVDDEYKQLLNQAYAELHAFKRKYARLSELDEIFALIP